jgi:predicted nucleic acid-binding protein
MSAKYFIDTNVLVYSFDHSQPVKRERSLALIQEALINTAGMISTQVIQEFLNVATQKFAIPMTTEDSKAYVRYVLNPICQVYPSLELFENCLDVRAETKYSFYDSLIIAAAIQGGCEIIYSEDLQEGQVIRGVKIVNPYQ